MCWSTGREPIAQPPGSETQASPKRASSGPSTRIEARMVFTISYGASSLSTCAPCSGDALAVLLDAQAHLAQQLQHGADILQPRHVGQVHRVGGQQAGAQDGQRRVLGAGNGDVAGQALAAGD